MTCRNDCKSEGRACFCDVEHVLTHTCRCCAAAADAVERLEAERDDLARQLTEARAALAVATAQGVTP